MASNFRFRILNGADPQAQYDAIAVKDPMVFYLLNTGIGYLGTVKLFDATEDSDIGNLVTNMLDAGFTADDTSVASTKAIVDYVADKVSNVSTVLTTSFFRKVVAHTLTADDLANEAISVPDGVSEGSKGLLFTADTDGEDGGESYYFVPLDTYLQSVYTPENSNSIEMTISDSNVIKAELRIKTGENSLKVDAETGGVYIDKATTINDGDGTDGTTAPSETKLVTEAAVVNFVKQALADVVTATIDNGTSTES